MGITTRVLPSDSFHLKLGVNMVQDLPKVTQLWTCILSGMHYFVIRHINQWPVIPFIYLSHCIQLKGLIVILYSFSDISLHETLQNITILFQTLWIISIILPWHTNIKVSGEIEHWRLVSQISPIKFCAISPILDFHTVSHEVVASRQLNWYQLLPVRVCTRLTNVTLQDSIIIFNNDIQI